MLAPKSLHFLAGNSPFVFGDPCFDYGFEPQVDFAWKGKPYQPLDPPSCRICRSLVVILYVVILNLIGGSPLQLSSVGQDLVCKQCFGSRDVVM